MKISNGVFAVTGGLGFIGSHLVKVLVGRGAAEVRVIDAAQRSSNLEKKLPEGVRLFHLDIRERGGLESVLEGTEGIFHLAALPMDASTKDFRACVEINISGSFSVFEAARQAGVQKIVYSSASSVYGDTRAVMDENDPLNPRSIYGATKLSAEYLLHALGAHSNLDYLILRYMNVYGPGQTGGLIQAVLRRLREGKPPVIFGDGKQSFDFVHVEDVVQANLLAMESDLSGEVFNVGSGEEYSVSQIVEFLLTFTASSLKPEYLPAPDVQMQRRVGSSLKAMKMLGYRPTIRLEKGLRQLADHPQVEDPAAGGVEDLEDLEDPAEGGAAAGRAAKGGAAKGRAAAGGAKEAAS